MSEEIYAHQIEELLLNAHLESEGGIDLIEEYFDLYSSLDRITEYAEELLRQESNKEAQAAVIKNLAECIVVKNQRDQRSLVGIFRRYLKRWGFSDGKRGEIRRAEKLVRDFGKDSC